MLFFSSGGLTGRGMGTANLLDEAVNQRRRCAKLGLRGAMIWCSSPEDRPYSLSLYDPFSAEAQDLDMPLSLHRLTGAGPESWLIVKDPMDRYIRSTVLSHEVQRTFTVLIFSGVRERFPRLKFVSAENEVGWLTFFLQTLDQAQDEYRYLYPSPLKMKPSEYFRQQCYATFIDDPVGVATRHFIGVDNIMWSSDYPPTVSAWPHSKEVVARDFQGVPENEKWQMVRHNAIALYSLDLN